MHVHDHDHVHAHSMDRGIAAGLPPRGTDTEDTDDGGEDAGKEGRRLHTGPDDDVDGHEDRCCGREGSRSVGTTIGAGAGVVEAAEEAEEARGDHHKREEEDLEDHGRLDRKHWHKSREEGREGRRRRKRRRRDWDWDTSATQSGEAANCLECFRLVPPRPPPLRQLQLRKEHRWYLRRQPLPLGELPTQPP